MSRRKLRVPDLPPESIGSVSTLDEADRIFKRIWGERAPATRVDIPPPCGWSRVKYFAGKVFMTKGSSI